MLHSPEHLARVLNTPMGKNSAGAATIREFFVNSAQALWDKSSQFSGKRPFGSSSWVCEIYVALIKADLIEGTLDEEGDVLSVDGDAADLLVHHALKYL